MRLVHFRKCSTHTYTHTSCTTRTHTHVAHPSRAPGCRVWRSTWPAARPGSIRRARSAPSRPCPSPRAPSTARPTRSPSETSATHTRPLISRDLSLEHPPHTHTHTHTHTQRTIFLFAFWCFFLFDEIEVRLPCHVSRFDGRASRAQESCTVSYRSATKQRNGLWTPCVASLV